MKPLAQVLLSTLTAPFWSYQKGSYEPLPPSSFAADDHHISPRHQLSISYTLANQPDKPDIALVVLVENIGEESAYAVPTCRRVVESYFFGQPTTLYPWESAVGVTAMPVLTTTQTTSPTKVPAPTPTP